MSYMSTYLFLQICSAPFITPTKILMYVGFQPLEGSASSEGCRSNASMRKKIINY